MPNVSNAPKTRQALTYRSYLLRVWRDDPQRPWRASLQSTHDEQLQHFTHLDAMFAHLLAQLESNSTIASSAASKPETKG